MAHVCAGFIYEINKDGSDLYYLSNFNENYLNNDEIEWECWGSNVDGQTDIPADVIMSDKKGGGNQMRDVYAGHRHTCFLTGRGKPICFGWNWSKQTEVPVK